MARVVVVGAGVGGLSAAVRLAAAGHRVTICEQAAEVGGKLGSYRRDGYAFDTGPSLLTLPAVYRDLFSKTGAPLEKVLDVVPVDPVAHYRFADGTELDVPNADRPGTLRAFDAAFGPGAGDDWGRLLDRAADMWRVTRGPFLETPLSPGSLLRTARPRDVATVAPWATLRGLGRRHLRDPRLRMYFERYATYSGSDPRRAPAALAVVPYVEQTFGAWYVRGGLRLLGEALHQRALERGVTVRTSTAVTRIEVESGRASGVLLADGERIAADVVVANADATSVYRDLVPAPWGRRGAAALRRATPSLSGFVLLLALRGRTPGLRHHTVLFPADYDAEFDAIFGREPEPVADPTIYISAPDDPALRPDADSEAWFVLVNAPTASLANFSTPGRAGVDWAVPGLADNYAKLILRRMAERGLDVRDRIRWQVTRTPADLARATGAPGGAIYGTSSNGARSAFLRPANRSALSGLFLVGGSAHPGGGLPLVGLSGAIVADLVGPA